ncbi:hypothetical protein OC845_002352 [Tilletia horrida]|nr:hypothetical protein OC845_002352 [Tilletia horrida]
MLQSAARRGFGSYTSAVSCARAAGSAESDTVGHCPTHQCSAWTSPAKRVRINPPASSPSVPYSTAASTELQTSDVMPPNLSPARIPEPSSAASESSDPSNGPGMDDTPGKSSEMGKKHDRRRARSDTIKILNRIMRFRSKGMDKLTPAQVYKLYLAEQPHDHSSHHHHPELWARLAKMAFNRRDAALLRRIAADTLDWCKCPLAQNFTQARNTNGDEERSINPWKAPLPATTENLKHLIRNLLSADETRIATTATRRSLIATETGLDPDRVSIRKVKQKLHASQSLIKRARTNSDMNDPKVVAALRFAWAQKIKNGPITEDIPEIEPLDLSEVHMKTRLVRQFSHVRHRELVSGPKKEADAAEEARHSEKAMRKLKRLENDPSQIPLQEALYLQVDPELADDQHWEQTLQLIEAARIRAGQDNWLATLDRFQSWAQATGEGTAPVVQEYIDILRSANPAPLDPKFAPRDRPRSRLEDAQQTKAQSLVREEAAQAARADEGLPSDGAIHRPPTYLLLATLRQLIVRRQPEKALKVALTYLRTLLADVRADPNGAKDMFSDHPACDEVREPDIVMKPERSTAKTKKRRKAENKKLRTEYIPVEPLFLRTHGPTYSVSAPLVPPKGHEILNAVLRAHLHAGHSVRSMVQSMRALCGVRVGRAIRAWESERREEHRAGGRYATHASEMSEIPFGLQREYSALTQLMQLPAELRKRGADWPSNGNFPIAKPHRSLRFKKVAQDANAPENAKQGEDTASQEFDLVKYYGLSTSLKGKSAVTPSEAFENPRKIDLKRRIPEAKAIFCYPNEETFLIMLEQIRRHDTSIMDAVGLITTALSVWGPPPVRPQLVPHNLPIHQLSSPESEIHRRLTVPTSSGPVDATETPYLDITTASVRKLLRWAMWKHSEAQGSRILEAGEAWIRHCREWMCARRGAAPVIVYDPASRAPDDLNKTSSVPFAERPSSPSAFSLIPSWMWIDGGKGYLHPSATPKERREWRNTLVCMLDDTKKQKMPGSTKSAGREDSEATEGAERQEALDVDQNQAGQEGIVLEQAASPASPVAASETTETRADSVQTTIADEEGEGQESIQVGTETIAHPDGSSESELSIESQDEAEQHGHMDDEQAGSPSADVPADVPSVSVLGPRPVARSWLSRAQIGLLAGLDSDWAKQLMRHNYDTFRGKAMKLGWRTPSEPYKNHPKGSASRTQAKQTLERGASWDVD